MLEIYLEILTFLKSCIRPCKWLWVWVQLQSLKLQISRLRRARTSLKFRQLQSVDHSETRTWDDKNIQLVVLYLYQYISNDNYVKESCTPDTIIFRILTVHQIPNVSQCSLCIGNHYLNFTKSQRYSRSVHILAPQR